MEVHLRIPRFNHIFYHIACSVWYFIGLRQVLRHTNSDQPKKCLVIQPLSGTQLTWQQLDNRCLITTVFPVPGAPEIYMLPGLWSCICEVRKPKIWPISLSLHTMLVGCWVFRARFADSKSTKQCCSLCAHKKTPSAWEKNRKSRIRNYRIFSVTNTKPTKRWQLTI